MLDKIPSAPPEEDETKTSIENKTPVENGKWHHRKRRYFHCHLKYSGENIAYVNLENSKRSAPKERRIKHLGTIKVWIDVIGIITPF